MKWLLVCLCLALLLIPAVVGTAPSISSLSPGNNTVFPTSNSVTATVSATDAESNPINFTWRNIPSVVMLNDSWKFTGCGVDSAPVNGSNFSVKNRIRAEDAGCTAVATAHFIISTDFMRVEYDIDQTAATATGVMFVGGDSIFSEAAGSLTNLSVNTTKYNNGSSIEIRFEISGSTAFNDYTLFWWFPQYKEGATSLSGGDTLVQSVVVQNSSSTSHVMSRFDLNNYVSPWKWGVTACDNNSECSSSDNFTITFSEFGSCSNPLFRKALNITVVDENSNATLVSTVHYVLNASDVDSSNEEVGNYVATATGDSDYSLCSDPYFITHELNNFLDYLPDSSDYTNTRFYHFVDTPVNPLAPLRIDLKALNDSLATVVVTTVKQSASPVSDAIIQLLRFDTSTATSSVVQSCQTNAEGKCSLLAQLNDALYSFVVITGGTTVLTTGFSQLTGSTLTLNLPESANDPSSEFREILGITYALSYDNDTGDFTCTFSDNNAETLTATLLVEQITTRATTTVNTSSVTSSSGTLTVNAPLVNGTTYRGTCSAVFPTGASGTLDILTITVPRGEGIYGDMGWFLFVLTAIVFSTVFLANPTAALILNAINLIIHKLIGTIPFDWGIIIGFVTVLMAIGIYTRLDRR